ncbi:MAG: phosphatase PAP2 family protein [Bdellovibrionaceae bacterium]|nr:phosphatase PAP2 family protein [Pseudobdellovibrionaceae bacterium]
MFNRRLLILIFFIHLVPYSGQAYDDIEKAGDYLQIAIPISAFLSAYGLEDENTPYNLSYKRFVKSFSYGLLTTHIIKNTLKKRRPNGDNEKSFPSGHTFAAVSGAAYIYSRFGYKFGIPAYLLAGFVGYSRIDSKNHYADDVLAGGIIAYLFNEYFTEPDNIEIHFSKTQDEFQVNLEVPLEDSIQLLKKNEFQLKAFLGPTFIKSLKINDENKLDYDIANLQNEKKDSYTSLLEFQFNLNKKGKILISIDPYQHLVRGNPSNDLQYENTIFQNSELTEFNWTQYNLELDYTRKVYNLGPVNLFAGMGLFTNYGKIEITSLQSSHHYLSERIGFIGNLIGQLGWNYSNSLSSLLKLNWFDDSHNKFSKLEVDLKYKLDRRWEIITRWQHFVRKLTLGDSKNTQNAVDIISDSSFDSIYFGMGYNL